MRVLVRVGQNQAIRAGKNDFGIKIVEIEVSTLTVEQREMLARAGNGYANGDGEGNTDCKRLYGSIGHYPFEVTCYDMVEATAENAIGLLTALVVEYARRKTEYETEQKKQAEQMELCIQRAVADGAEKRVDYDYRLGCYIVKRIPALPSGDPRLVALYDEAQKIADKRNQEKVEREAREQAEKEVNSKARLEKEIAVREARESQIADWVNTKGTDSQKKRLAAGLLPEDEIINDICDEAFEPLNDIPRYVKLTTGDVCTCDYEQCEVDFTEYNANTATESEYSKIEEIKKRLPAATVTLRVHTGEGEICKNEVERTGLRVVLSVGCFDFTREYEV